MKCNKWILLLVLTIVLNTICFSFSFGAQLYGDLNSDGSVDSTDYAMMKKHLLRITTITNTTMADLNGDGSVDSTDYSLFKRFLLNIIQKFPVEDLNPPTPSPTPSPLLNNHWVGTWVTAQQLTEQNNMPPSPGLSNNTLRQNLRVSIGGDKLRIVFSNQYGNAPLTMNSVHLAVSAGGSSIKTETDKALTFSGKESVTIPAGKTVVSDSFDYNLTKLTNMAVTIYFGSVPSNLTGHPGSRTTSYIQSGNGVKNASLSSPTKTDHWYVLSGIDVYTDESYRAVAILGDSITDGRGSTTNENNRWPDMFANSLQSDPATSKVAVLNQGIGGNTVLSGGLGPTALTRFDRDILEQSGVRWAIIFEGVNDIGSSSNASVVSTSLINAYKEFIRKAKAKNILVYGATILPFGGSQYSSAIHEEARKTVNNWIRTSGEFDAIIDFDAGLRDPNDPSKLQSKYDSGDKLHLNPEGYKKMGEMIDHNLFK